LLEGGGKVVHVKSSRLGAQTQVQLASGVSLASALLAAVLGCSARVHDETPLSALSPDERQALCDEVADTLPSSDEAITCPDGATVTFSEPDAGACDVRVLDTCTASAGDLRACLKAMLDDPCTAFERPPAACVPLRAAGCESSFAAPALGGQCAAAASSDIRPFEGIYELARHTHNDGACSAEGPSVVGDDAQPLFVLVNDKLASSPVGVLRSCRDRADCQNVVAEIRTASQQPLLVSVETTTPVPDLSDLFLCKAQDQGSLLGGGFSVGPRPEGDCALTRTKTTLSRAADGTLRAERRTFAWTTPDENGSCSYEGNEPPSDAQCSGLEIYEGRFLTAL
jgi:hypothetical protein